jgi:hypothetical protein
MQLNKSYNIKNSREGKLILEMKLKSQIVN